MPRRSRLVLPGVPLHVTQRGIDRRPVFLDDADFAYYLLALRLASVEARCAVHAYVLMTNHVHLLLTPADRDGPARLTRSLGTRYVRRFNRRHGRTGTLWEGRYRSATIASDRHLLACVRYIELNPQRAGIASDPGAYPWSSYGRNALGRPDPVVTPHPLHTALGRTDDEQRAAYRALFDRPLDADDVGMLRTAPHAPRPLPVSRYHEVVEQLIADRGRSLADDRAPLALVREATRVPTARGA